MKGYRVEDVMTWDDVRINKNPESLKIHEVQQELKTRRDTLWWNCRTQKTLPLPCPLAEDWTQFLSNKTQWPRKVRKIIAGQIQRRYRIGKSGDVLIGGATEGTQCSSSSSACVSALGELTGMHAHIVHLQLQNWKKWTVSLRDIEINYGSFL